jgi:hypothetical protein
LPIFTSLTFKPEYDGKAATKTTKNKGTTNKKQKKFTFYPIWVLLNESIRQIKQHDIFFTIKNK